MDGVRVRVHPMMVPVGGTAFPAPYLDLLRDLAHLPRPKLPASPIHAHVLLAVERLRLLRHVRLVQPKLIVG